jgi:hypothetical protein
MSQPRSTGQMVSSIPSASSPGTASGCWLPCPLKCRNRVRPPPGCSPDTSHWIAFRMFAFVGDVRVEVVFFINREFVFHSITTQK